MAEAGAVSLDVSRMRRVLSWLALVSLGAIALLLLNSALFSAWMSGGPPNPYADGWALRSLALLVWALTAAFGAAAFFHAIRRATRVGKASVIVLAACMTLVAVPFLVREVLIDKCLDNGGRWSAQALACEH